MGPVFYLVQSHGVRDPISASYAERSNIEEARAAESKLKGESRSIRMEDFLSWGQCFT